MHKGDLIIIITYRQLEEARMPGYKPTVVFVDEKNRPTATDVVEETAFTLPPAGMLP
ncbi:Aspartate 1-decarboxylase precursor [compost metagenome]